ncbi:MAG: hypothetical protein WCJ66_03630 [Verrucomicrobiota bacterium]
MQTDSTWLLAWNFRRYQLASFINPWALCRQKNKLRGDQRARKIRPVGQQEDLKTVLPIATRAVNIRAAGRFCLSITFQFHV